MGIGVEICAPGLDEPILARDFPVAPRVGEFIGVQGRVFKIHAVEWLTITVSSERFSRVRLQCLEK